MSRKAQALPMNTVIIAILVVLVLFVVGAFFLGGTGGIMKTIRQIFFGTTAGSDRVFAAQTCENRCEQLKLLPIASVSKSAYCQQNFLIDENNDGEADCTTPDGRCTTDPKVYKKYYCYTKNEEGAVSLGVPCPLPDGRTPEQYCQPTAPLPPDAQSPPYPIRF